MKYLGPLSCVDGSRAFYVDLSNQLDVSETLSVVLANSTDSNMAISSSGALTEDITTKDGHVLSAGKCIYFRASYLASKTAIIPISINYTTTGGNSDTTIVYLKVVPAIQ